MQKPQKWIVPLWLDRLGRAGWLAIGIVLCLGVGIYFFSTLRTITLPFVLAALGAAVCFPIVDKLEKWHLRRSIAALLVLLLMLAVVVVIGLLVLTQIINQSSELAANLTAGLQKVKESGAGPHLEAAVDSVSKSLADFWKPLLQGFLPALVEGLGAIASLGFAVFIAINIFYYLMADGRRVGRWLGRSIGLPAELGIGLVRSSVRSLQGYFAGATVVAAFNGVAIGVTALILGTPMAGVVALINFLFSYIPYIGAIVGGAVAVLLALGGGGWTDAAIMLVVLILVNSVFQVIISQIAFGKTLSLHPLVVLLSTTAGGVLAGAIGSALAAPFVAVAIEAVRRIGDSGIFKEEQVALPAASTLPVAADEPSPEQGEPAEGGLAREPVGAPAHEPLTAPAS
jgi:predicted PurR-regulated permease PerM